MAWVSICISLEIPGHLQCSNGHPAPNDDWAPPKNPDACIERAQLIGNESLGCARNAELHYGATLSKGALGLVRSLPERSSSLDSQRGPYGG